MSEHADECLCMTAFYKNDESVKMKDEGSKECFQHTTNELVSFLIHLLLNNK